MKTKTCAGILFVFSLFCCISCNSLKQPDSIQEPLNYTDEDIIISEIERIENLKDEYPVKALWRANLLGKEETFSDCYNLVTQKLETFIEEKDYFNAYRYFISLKTVRPEEDYSVFAQKIEELYASTALVLDVPEDKLPESISDCVKATVTVWLDKGLKVENGTGMADVIIGSGFFIDKRGYLITNHHVIEDSVSSKYEGYSRLYVKMHPDTDTKIPAKVIGYDPILDLALLKVEVEPEVVLRLGSSTDLNIGDKVSAIGTPIGLEGTLTAGIISSTDRKLLTLGNVFQIDTAVNAGNSGGPLIDEKMNVQAIVFAGMVQFQGLNFAIPVEYLKQELKYLFEGGEVQHSWIAGFGRTIRKGNKKMGLEIQYVIPGGSACMSLMKTGEIIVEANGVPVQSIEDFQFNLMGYQPDTIIPIKVLDAEGEEKVYSVYLEKRSSEPNALAYKSDFITNSFIPMFGMKLKPASTVYRNSYVIEKVIRGGLADETGFSENDQVTVRDVKIDYQNKYIATQLFTKQKNKGFLDVPMFLSNTLDSPYYF